MQTSSSNTYSSTDATAANDWRSDYFVGVGGTAASTSTVRVIYGESDAWPAGPGEPEPRKRKYDPFGAVGLWARPKRSKTPPSFVKFNAVPTQRPRNGRRGRK